MKKVILILGLAICYLTSFSQETGTFKDPRDGKVYKTVTIGTQSWFAENLAYKPTNGNCWAYANDTTNIAKNGYLYDWETAKTVAPKGWHLPTKEDWETLYNKLGNDPKMVFKQIEQGGSSGFNAMLCGVRQSDGTFGGIDAVAFFWSATVFGENRAYDFHSYASFGSANTDSFIRSCGFSVRLLKDN